MGRPEIVVPILARRQSPAGLRVIRVKQRVILVAMLPSKVAGPVVIEANGQFPTAGVSGLEDGARGMRS